MPGRFSRWIRLALAVAAVGVAVFAILELVLRLAVGDLYATVYRPDPVAHYRLAPGSEKTFQRPAADGGEHIRVAINSDGFRGEALGAAGAALRVLLYGDSFVAAEFSALEHTFAERLESHLAADRGAPVEVVNAGISGYGPDQSLLRMREDLPALGPDLVVLAIYAGNDFGDLLRNKLFVLGPEGSLRQTRPQLDRMTALRLRWSPYAPVLYKVIARAYYNWTHAGPSAGDPARASARRLESWWAQRESEWQETLSGDLRVTNLRLDTPDLDVAARPQEPAAQYKLALMEGVLGEVGRTASQAGIPLLLVLIPSVMDACQNHPAGHLERADFPAYRPSGPTTRLSHMADRLAIASLDLFDDFARQDDCGFYFRSDTHWNDRGQEEAARRAADAIAAHGLLGPPAKSRSPGGR